MMVLSDVGYWTHAPLQKLSDIAYMHVSYILCNENILFIILVNYNRMLFC